MPIKSQLKRVRRRLKASSHHRHKTESLSIYESVRIFLAEQQESPFLFGFDDFANLGDQALWISLDMVLRHLPKHLRPRGLLPETDYLDAKQFRDKVIIFPGGGSLGSRYHSSRRRVELIEKLRPSAIIQMPISTSFSNDPAVTKHRVRLAYTSPTSALIFVRDETSKLEAFSELGLDTELQPDLSSALPYLGDLHAGGKGTLYLMRSDRESCGWNMTDEIKGTVADWETMPVPRTYELKIARFLFRVTCSWRLPQKIIGSAMLARVRLQLARVIALNETARALSFLSQFDRVVTDRLHGVLLAEKIGVPVFALDNDHGKVSRYLASWNEKGEHGVSVPLLENIDSRYFTSQRRTEHDC